MAGLYSYYLAPLVLTPTMVNIPQTVNTGNRLGGWLIVYNNSPYKIQVQLPGSGNTLPLDPQTVDKFVVNTGDQVISILPLTLLPGSSPTSQVDIQVYPGPDPDNEPPGTYPMALSRQTAPSSSLVAGFTTAVLFTSSTIGAFALVLFNPANSSKVLVVTAARVGCLFTTTTPQGSLNYVNSDPGLGASTINPNTAGSTIVPVAKAETSSASVPAASANIEFVPLISGQPREFIPFPSQRKVLPGNGLFVEVSSGPTSSVQYTGFLEWTEQ